MTFHRLPFLFLSFLASVGLAAAEEKSSDDKKRDSKASCACPMEGSWKAQNLEGWMNCTGPVNIKRKLSPVKDKGTVWVLKENCSSIFSEASKKEDEDILMEKEEACRYQGTVSGNEDGVTMTIDVIWTLASEKFIKGEMHSKPSFQGMTCEYFRPFEITFEEAIPEDEYEKRKKTMQKKLENIRKKD